jgi:hypothetical protein
MPFLNIDGFVERNNLSILAYHRIKSGNDIRPEVLIGVVPRSSNTSKHFADVTKDFARFPSIANDLQQIIVAKEIEATESHFAASQGNHQVPSE